MVFRLVENAFVSQIFTMSRPDKTLPMFLPSPPKQRKITNSPQATLFSLSVAPAKKKKEKKEGWMGGRDATMGPRLGLFFKMAPVI